MQTDSSHELKILNVFQGSCSIIRPLDPSQGHSYAIIDIGTSTKGQFTDNTEQALNNIANHLDDISYNADDGCTIYLIISHEDEDHQSYVFVRKVHFTNFLESVTQKNEVIAYLGGNFADFPDEHLSEVTRPIDSLQSIKIELGGNTTLNIRIPPKTTIPNEQSILVSVDPFSVLLPADANKKTINDSFREEVDSVKHRIYSLTHHGSKNQTNGLLDIIDPEIVLISGACQNYGHPSSKVFEKSKGKWKNWLEKGQLMDSVEVNGSYGDFSVNVTCYEGAHKTPETKNINNHYIFSTFDCGNISIKLEDGVRKITTEKGVTFA